VTKFHDRGGSACGLSLRVEQHCLPKLGGFVTMLQMPLSKQHEECCGITQRYIIPCTTKP
jgi:hypothetical protein